MVIIRFDNVWTGSACSYVECLWFELDLTSCFISKLTFVLFTFTAAYFAWTFGWAIFNGQRCWYTSVCNGKKSIRLGKFRWKYCSECNFVMTDSICQQSISWRLLVDFGWSNLKGKRPPTDRINRNFRRILRKWVWAAAEIRDAVENFGLFLVQPETIFIQLRQHILNYVLHWLFKQNGKGIFRSLFGSSVPQWRVLLLQSFARNKSTTKFY